MIVIRGNTLHQWYEFFRSKVLGQNIIIRWNFRRVKKYKDKNNQISVFGDSHTMFFCGKNLGLNSWFPLVDNKQEGWGIKTDSTFLHFRKKKYCVLWVGPGLAYNLINKNSHVKVYNKAEFLSKYFWNYGDKIICSFGEIDIRTHILKYTDERSYKEIVDDTVEKYIDFLKWLRNLGNYRIAVWGPIASQKDIWEENPQFPRVGTEVERNTVTHYFNEKLSLECKKNGFGFYSIFSKLVDNNMKTKEEFILDKCHLKPSVWNIIDEDAFWND